MKFTRMICMLAAVAGMLIWACKGKETAPNPASAKVNQAASGKKMPLEEQKPPALKPTTRFVISESEKTVTDKETGLTWQRTVSVDGFTWKNAFDHCKLLKLDNDANEWRLPTLKEMQSLITEPKKPSMLYIDGAAFPHTPSDFFWTASANDHYVAGVFFDMSQFPTGVGPHHDLGHVRCVCGKLMTTYQVPESASYNLMTVPRN